MGRRDQRIEKSSLSPTEWRRLFDRVHLHDQCFPGAMHAAFVSADKIFGTRFTKDHDRRFFNRQMGYHQGIATGTDAAEREPLLRYIQKHRYTITVSRDAYNAFDHLKTIVDSLDNSFPVVGVRPELIRAYDPNARFIGDQVDVDHAVVVLKIADSVEIWDPTFEPAFSDPDTVERVPVADFLKNWAGNPTDPYYRAWILRFEPSFTPKKGLKGVPSIHTFGPRRRRKIG